jgi:hypothetical protein
MAETVHHKGKFSGSVGAGVKSVLAPKGRTFYVLEHKMSSRNHKMGEKQEIIIDYAELGRSPKCQVQFDESFGTVSGVHAAIVREGDTWKLKHLSKTNPTLLNGRPVAKEWFLQNGDEIQLSYEGPKLGFLVPGNNTTGSLALTKRLSLFRQQALRPYKRALVAICAVFVVAIAGLVGLLLWQNREISGLKAEAEQARALIDSLKQLQMAGYESTASRMDSMKTHFNKSLARFATPTGNKPSVKIDTSTKLANPKSEDTKEPVTQPPALSELSPYVYWITTTHISVENEDGTLEKIEYDGVWTGTGCLLSDGRFVTARHIIEPWYYKNFLDGDNAELLLLINELRNAGTRVVVHYEAISATESFLFSNEDFKINRRGDVQVGDYRFADFNSSDWAYMNLNKTSAIAADAKQATQMKSGENVFALGFPFNLGTKDFSSITPLQSIATVIMDGLNDGMIVTSATTAEAGMSGAPVFYKHNDKYYAVGIVSSIAGRNTGLVVPLSALK